MSDLIWTPPVVLLVEPQNGLNVGGVVRACRNFGVVDVRLVQPAAVEPERWEIMAPGCGEWMAEHVSVFDEWALAVEGIGRLYAFSARSRRDAAAPLSLGEICPRPSSASMPPAGFVFGREDHGLPNWVLEACDGVVRFDTNPKWTSLNLAQSVLLAVSRAWEMGAQGGAAPSAMEREPGDARQREQLMGDAVLLLEKVGFFKGDQRDNIVRTLRRVLLRADLDPRELATLRGMVRETLRALPEPDTSVD